MEIAQGELDAAQEKARQSSRADGRLAGEAQPWSVAGHLPSVERIIEPKNTLCPCGCGEMAKIGEDVSERLDVIPAQCASWSRVARNTPAAAARERSCRRMHRSTSFLAACRPRR